MYNVCLKKGLGQLIVHYIHMYLLSIYPSVHNQLIRTFFEAHFVEEVDTNVFVRSPLFIFRVIMYGARQRDLPPVFRNTSKFISWKFFLIMFQGSTMFHKI